MRRISIHPAMFHDEVYVTISSGARLLILGLGVLSDRRWQFRWDAAAIQSFVFSRASVDIDALLLELQAAGMIRQSGEGVGEVLFLYGFRRRRVQRWERIRQAIFERDEYRCRYCGSAAEPLHCDHVVPQSKGGTDDPENLATACAPCNLSKHDKALADWKPA